MIYQIRLMAPDVKDFIARFYEQASEDDTGEVTIIAIAPASMNIQPGGVMVDVTQYNVWYSAEHEIR